ncbi:MAG: hypothetical protein ACD_79C01090G0003 [uncultured bacterium]|nr:MAG: hypothetical protein ACD_79C01090G0003 [uncultured bacterium]
MLFPKNKKNSGSALIIALIFAFVMSTGIASILKLQSEYHKINARNFGRTQAIYTAESAVELFMYELNYKDSSERFGNGWTINGNTYTFIDSGGNSYSTIVKSGIL